MAMSNDGGSKYLWNNDKQLPNYKVLLAAVRTSNPARDVQAFKLSDSEPPEKQL
jgi:hypothetical protein